MKFIKESNISKIRKFPTYGDSSPEKKKDRKFARWCNSTDHYFIYNVLKKDLGKWLNTWFVGQRVLDEKTGFTLIDEMWTVKKVDKKTALSLYRREFNPISISIYPPTGGSKHPRFGKSYNMIARIHSIDDSSFGMWFNDKTIEECYDIRKSLMKYVDSKSEMNGDDWFEFGKSLGANDFDTN